MAVEKTKKQNSKSKSSAIQKRSTKKVVKSSLSNDELLEQIMTKKKPKEQKKSTTLNSLDSKITSVNKSTEKVENVVKNPPKKTVPKNTKANSNVNKKSTTKKNTSVKKKSTSVKKKNLVNKTNLNNDDIYDQIKKKKKSTSTKKKQISVEKKTTEDVEIQKDITLLNNDSDDTIITRELNFDADKFDVKNKKLLRELKDAIKDFELLEENVKEEFSEVKITDCLEDSTGRTNEVKDLKEPVDNSTLITTHVKKNYKKKDKKHFIRYDNHDKEKMWLLVGCVILFLLLMWILSVHFVFRKDNSYSLKAQKNDVNVEVEEVDLRPELYQSCLTRELSENDRTQDIISKENELNEYLSNNYVASVLYEDLSLGFTYGYNTSNVYYAASTAKTLGALYIYTKAASGELNLDETMIYSSKYKWRSSKEMANYSFGQEVTLRNLVKYSITVSDNSAHQMLVSYIGRSKLKEFGLSLGAKNTLSGYDNFGDISVEDAIIYMKALNNFIESNGELGQELKSYFVSAEQNDLELIDLNIQAAHKYGHYSNYYHDIGIVYDEKPYAVAILTREGNKSNYEAKIKDINARIYELHRLYNDTRQSMCWLEVYGN